MNRFGKFLTTPNTKLSKFLIVGVLVAAAWMWIMIVIAPVNAKALYFSATISTIFGLWRMYVLFLKKT